MYEFSSKETPFNQNSFTLFKKCVPAEANFIYIIESVDSILQEFDDVLSSRPGRTQLTECCVNTGRASPIRLPPYRLLYAYRDIVKSELEEMEKDGIIELSSSE